MLLLTWRQGPVLLLHPAQLASTSAFAMWSIISKFSFQRHHPHIVSSMQNPGLACLHIPSLQLTLVWTQKNAVVSHLLTAYQQQTVACHQVSFSCPRPTVFARPASILGWLTNAMHVSHPIKLIMQPRSSANPFVYTPSVYSPSTAFLQCL